jgi:N6-L-threonylcarbamoyladenine synthase
MRLAKAYDKVARTMGLPYPGGPHIDKLAQKGEANVPLPRAWLEEGSYHFSFSGLKSAVINTLHNASQKGETIAPEDLSASFQESVMMSSSQKRNALRKLMASNKCCLPEELLQTKG